jgi:RHS repeat-associated protein
LQNENGAFHRFEYDLMDRLVKETGFDGRVQRYHYDVAGQLTAKVEESLPEAPVTRYAYDKAGRLVARHLPATKNRGPMSEHYRWEKDGQLNGVDAPGSRVDFQYDEAGRLVCETQRQRHVTGSEWQWRHRHAHTPLGVRQHSTYGDLPPIQWLTYGAGHLHGIKLPGNIDLDFERDDLHREVERTVRNAAQFMPLFARNSDYGPLGGLAQQEILVGGAVTERRRYQRDELHRLTAIDLDGHPEKSLRYEYDPSNRLIASQHGTEHFRYRLDPAGNRIHPEPRSPEDTEEDWRETVRKNLHDPNFNVLACTLDDALQASTQWPDNRVVNLEGVQNQYDGAGNLIERTLPDGTRFTFHYDGAHRLTLLARDDPDGNQVQALYAYDGFSRRIYKEVLVTGEHGSRITRYGWEGDRQIYEECENDKTRATIVYEPGSFIPLARIEQGQTPVNEEDDEYRIFSEKDRNLFAAMHAQMRGMFEEIGLEAPAVFKPDPGPLKVSVFLTDHAGTPYKLIDSEGKTLWEAEADDWGAVRNEKGIRQPIRFQGQYHDEETGLYYNRFRFYDPLQGRYITQDPIGLMGGMNGFAYPTNPVGWGDPLGLACSPADNAAGICHEFNEYQKRLEEARNGRSQFLGRCYARFLLDHYKGVASNAWTESKNQRRGSNPSLEEVVVPGSDSEARRNAEHYLYAYSMISSGENSELGMSFLSNGYTAQKLVGELFGKYKYSPSTFEEWKSGNAGMIASDIRLDNEFGHNSDQTKLCNLSRKPFLF